MAGRNPVEQRGPGGRAPGAVGCVPVELDRGSATHGLDVCWAEAAGAAGMRLGGTDARRNPVERRGPGRPWLEIR